MRSLFVIGSPILALYLIHAAAFGWYVADDAGISLAYARNLVQGYGPVLYPGAPVVEGYSNPLWVALLSLGALFRLDGHYGIPLMKILGLALGACSLLFAWLLARQAYPDDGRNPWVAPALLAIWTPFVFWNGAGLENGLYACLLTLAALLQLRELAGVGRRPWSAVALLGVALTRPEGCAFFVAFLAHRLVAGPRAWRMTLAWAAIFVAGYAAFLGLRFYVFGDWLPNTYYAKVTDRSVSKLLTYARDTRDDGRQYLIAFARAWWPALVVAVVGLADVRRWRANLLFAGVLGGTAAYALYVGGDFWPAGRFFSAALPFVAVAAQHGVEMVGRRVPRARVVLAAGVLLAVTTISVRASLDLRRRHHDDTLISLQGRIAQGERIRQFANTLGIDDPLYLDADIGGPTLVGLRVLDLGGLTDISIARFRYYPDFLRRYVFEEQRPHFIRTHASWTASSRITAFPEFAEQYTPIREYRDARGLHGEFVRRDLAGAAPPRPAASFSAARTLAREIRAREDARERDGWIEYYSVTRQYDRLLAGFRAAEAAGTLPRERARLDELYFALLAAGDRSAAERVARHGGLSRRTPLTLHVGDQPVISVVDYRVVERWPDPTTSLILYLAALDARASGFTLWLHLYPTGGGKRITRDRELDALEAGRTVAIEIPIYVPAADYDVRIGAWHRGSNEPLCTDTSGTACYLLLGTHRIGR